MQDQEIGQMQEQGSDAETRYWVDAGVGVDVGARYWVDAGVRVRCRSKRLGSCKIKG